MAKKDGVELLKCRIARLEHDNEELTAANRQVGLALDAVLSEIIRKYGANDEGTIVLEIPVPDISEGVRVSAQKAGDTYILRLEEGDHERQVGE